MATVYSLQDFRNEILTIAKIINSDYTSGRVEFDSDGNITFFSYTTKTSWTEGKTMEDCLTKTREKITNLSAVMIDVAIDLIPDETDPLPIDTLSTDEDFPF